MGESAKIGTRGCLLLSKGKPRHVVFVGQLSCVFIQRGLDRARCLVLLLYHFNCYMPSHINTWMKPKF